jgi:hypothetical protein
MIAVLMLTLRDPLSLQVLGARAGKKGVTVLAANTEGDIFVFSLAAVKDEQVGNHKDRTSAAEKARSTIEKLRTELRNLARARTVDTHAHMHTHAHAQSGMPLRTSTCTAHATQHARAITIATVGEHTHAQLLIPK